MAKIGCRDVIFFCGDKCEYVCFLHLLCLFAKIVLFLYTTNWCTFYTYKDYSHYFFGVYFTLVRLFGCSVGLLSVLNTFLMCFILLLL